MKLPKITEREFMGQVIEYARMRKWMVAHFRPAMTKDGRWRTAVQADGAGFVDLVLVRDRVIFAELKRDGGRLTDEQVAWGAALLKAGACYRHWTPSEWQEIEKELE